MSYRSNSIPNIRTIKAMRGEALKIDLGKTFVGTLIAWMKRDPNDLEYRSFEIQDGRYLYLSKEKASDYVDGGEVVSEIEGKWYFDVEQEIVDVDTKTIYRGTILFQNDITGSNGAEQPAPADGRYRTVDIALYLPEQESFSGTADNASETFIEHKNEIEALKGVKVDSAYKFNSIIDGSPIAGEVTLDSNDFASVENLHIHKLDGDNFNNSYFIEELEVGNFITLRSADSSTVVAFELLSEAVKDGDIYSFSVALESNVGNIFLGNEGISIEGLVKAVGGSTLTEEVVVIGVGVVGALSDGDTLIEGTPYTEFVKRLVQKSYPPTSPSANLVVTPGTTQEIGATVSFTLTPSFIQNDAGGINNVVFKRNGTIIQTQSTLTPYIDTNQVISAGSLSYSVEVSYDDGQIFTGPGKVGQILADTKISVDSVIGSYRNWYGPSLLPISSDEIRFLNYSYSNSFTLDTGSSAKIHAIAIPSTRTLISVIDEDALNADITSSYILSNITTVKDGGGNDVSYKVYILSLGVPYSSSHRHNITIN